MSKAEAQPAIASARAGIPLEGEFNCWTRDFDLPDLLVAICRRKETGLLRFVSAEAEKTLFLREGQIIFATSSSLDDRLGEYLLRRGKMRLKALAELGRQIKPGKRLGTLLVEKDLISAKELVRAVVDQVRAIVISLFRWTEAWYGFNAQELPSKETITLNMSTPDLVLEGIRQIDSWRRISKGVGEPSTIYRTVAGYEAVAHTMSLEEQALEVLESLRGAKRVEHLCSVSKLNDFELCRLLWAYRSLGLIEVVAEAELARADELAVDAAPPRTPEAPPPEVRIGPAAAARPDSTATSAPPPRPFPVSAGAGKIPSPPAVEKKPAPSTPPTASGVASVEAPDSDLEALGLVLDAKKAGPPPGARSPKSAGGKTAPQAGKKSPEEK